MHWRVALILVHLVSSYITNRKLSTMLHCHSKSHEWFCVGEYLQLKGMFMIIQYINPLRRIDLEGKDSHRYNLCRSFIIHENISQILYSNFWWSFAPSPSICRWIFWAEDHQKFLFKAPVTICIRCISVASIKFIEEKNFETP